MRLFLMTVFSFFYLNADISKALETIKEIKSYQATSKETKLHDPFIKEKITTYTLKAEVNATEITKEKVFSLEVIFNQKARINAKWYKKGDKIEEFTVVSIKKKSVVLEKNERFVTLHTGKNMTVKVSQ